MRKIKLNGKKGGIAKIDDEDYDLILKYKWHKDKDGYAVSTLPRSIKPRTTIKMHRLIVKCPKEFQVNHLNFNKLDNRKSNLQVCTQSENIRHSKRNIICSGVCFDKNRNKWKATINVNNKKKFLGRFDKREDALIIRKQAENKYW